MFQGLRTAIYHVDNSQAARDWYSALLGFAPYFDEPFYVGFNVGGYELGLQPREPSPADPAQPTQSTQSTQSTPPAAGPPPARPTVVAYWGVPDARAAVARALTLGARLHEDVQDVGDGILVATVLDPSGNPIGIIQNPHFSLKET